MKGCEKEPHLWGGGGGGGGGDGKLMGFGVPIIKQFRV